jgi:5-methyltetrahydrofolate--homocysteine methyltransferase
MSNLLDYLKDHVLLCDGAMGTMVQARDLDIDRDFMGKENCTEALILSRPDVVVDIHTEYLNAGSDLIQTNTFGGSPITLAEFDLEDQAYEINRKAGELAREAIEGLGPDSKPRFVMGAIGPGTRLPSLGHIDYASLEAALAEQCRGLADGGVDAFLIETCQDTLQIKAAVNGAKKAREASGRNIPIFVQVTVETTGTLLVGSDIGAAATALHALDIDSLGLNCATGPQEMGEHIKWLSENWPGLISIQPNAGLPELVDGHTHYPLGPDEAARWLERFVKEDGINIVGGCCGTTPDHIRAFDKMLSDMDKDRGRPTPATRSPEWIPSVASLYSQVPYRQENAWFAIGERCNANGSKKFRELLDAEDWDACVAIGRDQVKEGSHTLDVCTAFVGRNEVRDMTEVVSRMRGAVQSPLVIDSTELPVLEEALALYGGKAVINSINFEDGEEPAEKRLKLARRFGAAVVALTIDEEGMAKDLDSKMRIARRLYDFAVDKHGLPPEDLMFDPLTFTICTGNVDDRELARETLHAIKALAKELPRCQIILGLSNVSFGLKPAARHVLNSVFMEHALQAGMTGAIVHVSKIAPIHKIPENEKLIVEDLIFNRRGAEGTGGDGSDDYDPLHALIDLFEDRKAGAAAEKVRPAEIEERLKQRIIDGDRQELNEDLDEAMKKYSPLEIVNELLLDGMKVVGELFGSGQMQLPFVLQSAETMKAAVAYLEPFMEKADGQAKGTIVLATVKGDVHDIGKNLVDIILTNNGYRVVNLGIKQPIAHIIEATRENKADAVGMSGLLVKSTVIMRENLEEMTREGLDVPVLLGGAALTRRYVEEDCSEAYGSGHVAYAKDAFDGLGMMKHINEGTFDDHVKGAVAERAAKPKSSKRLGAPKEESIMRPVDFDEIRTRRDELARDVNVPTPPFWGAKVIEKVELEALVPFLNETMLYQFHWGFRKAGRDRDDFRKWAEENVRPTMQKMVQTCIDEEILHPQAAYGYWKAAAEGNDIVLFNEDGSTEAARFALPRQARENGLCISDFLRDVDSGERDVLGLQVVTVGQHASEVAREWFENDRYQDYLYLHGLGVEMAEAMAEYVHKRIRGELGFSHEDDRNMIAMLKQGYRGSRYSFGYPACPNLGDQHALLELLGADRVGIVMGEEDQLHPEQSTSAIVLHHPQAKYFSV